MARHSHPFPESVTDLADRLGVGRTHLSEVINGTARPSGLLAFRIEQATKGRIKASDLLGFDPNTDPVDLAS